MSRYERQIPVVGDEGQRRMMRSRVGIAGCGGLGVNALTPLVEAGVTEFVLCDPAVPSIADMNTQYIYAAGDMRPKCGIAAEWALALNCTVQAQAVQAEVDAESAAAFDGCSVVLDCAGSRRVSEALSDRCVATGTPLVHASVSGTTGFLFTQIPGGPTLSDALAEAGEAEDSGRIGAATSAVASMQALEAIRLIAGMEPAFSGPAVRIDLGTMSVERVRLRTGTPRPLRGAGPPGPATLFMEPRSRARSRPSDPETVPRSSPGPSSERSSR